MNNMIGGNSGIFSHPMIPSLPGKFSADAVMENRRENISVNSDSFELAGPEPLRQENPLVFARQTADASASAQAGKISDGAPAETGIPGLALNSIDSVARDGIISLSGEKIA